MYITEQTGVRGNPEATVPGPVQGGDPVKTPSCFEPVFAIEPPNALRGGCPNGFIGEFGECYGFRGRRFFFRREGFGLVLSHQNSAAFCAKPEVTIAGGE